MITYNRILTVLRPDETNQPALSRAIEIADLTDAAIDAVLVVYDHTYDMTTMLSREEREAMKAAVLKERTKWAEQQFSEYQQHKVNVNVFWSDRRYEAIIRHAIETSADIVVKATHQHNDLASVLFTPTDWHLIRKCPVPVLLVKDHAWPKNGNIITPVNVGTEDREHAALNDKLTTIAKDYAELLSGQVHLVNAFPATPLNIAIEIPDFNPKTYHDSVRNYHLQQMELHSAKFAIGMDNCHVMEGFPETVVQRTCKQFDAELVVIGTVGRTGLSATFIGNTAEQVIDNIECDVLAVKPDGFKCPVH